MRLRFCSAWPAMPFIRLSMADRTTTRSPRPVHGDVAEVAAGDVAQGGGAAAHADEELGAVALFVERCDVDLFGDGEVRDREDAAGERAALRNHRDVEAVGVEAFEFVDDLGFVLVGQHLVRAHVAGALGVVGAGLGVRARAGAAGRLRERDMLPVRCSASGASASSAPVAKQPGLATRCAPA